METQEYPASRERPPDLGSNPLPPSLLEDRRRSFGGSGTASGSRVSPARSVCKSAFLLVVFAHRISIHILALDSMDGLQKICLTVSFQDSFY